MSLLSALADLEKILLGLDDTQFRAAIADVRRVHGQDVASLVARLRTRFSVPTAQRLQMDAIWHFHRTQDH